MAKSIVNPKTVKASQVIGRISNCQRLLEEAGLSFEDWQSPIDDAEFRRQLVEFWRSRGGKREAGKSASNVFPVTVDHTQSIKQMIAAGKYDWMNSDITEKNFPREKKEGKEKVDLELIHFNKVMTSDQVLAELKSRGYRLATLPELLAFGVAYKDKQREFPIVALGSVWRRPYGFRYVPVLWGDSDERYLFLRWLGVDWHEDYRFLAVREG